jgi:hypothetical protein
LPRLFTSDHLGAIATKRHVLNAPIIMNLKISICEWHRSGDRAHPLKGCPQYLLLPKSLDSTVMIHRTKFPTSAVVSWTRTKPQQDRIINQLLQLKKDLRRCGKGYSRSSLRVIYIGQRTAFMSRENRDNLTIPEVHF